jgi:hypothetical protein
VQTKLRPPALALCPFRHSLFLLLFTQNSEREIVQLPGPIDRRRTTQRQRGPAARWAVRITILIGARVVGMARPGASREAVEGRCSPTHYGQTLG